MASKISKAKAEENWGDPIDMVEFGRALAVRRAELGNPPGTRNSGKRRTASKKALLEAIEATGKRW